MQPSLKPGCSKKILKFMGKTHGICLKDISPSTASTVAGESVKADADLQVNKYLNLVSEIWLTKPGVFQNNEEEVNTPMSISDIRDGLFAYDFKDEDLNSLDSKPFDEAIYLLKKNAYPNIIQGAGKSLNEARDNWNSLYFIDLDIKEWTAGTTGMKQCIQELATSFPNHLMIKPSNRFGIHLVLAAQNECYAPAEHLFYAILAHRVVVKYNPIYKETELEKHIMDPAFFNSFSQRMNLNLYTYYDGKRYKVTDFAVFNTAPTQHPVFVSDFKDYHDILTDDERRVVEHYQYKLFGNKKKSISAKNTSFNVVAGIGQQFNIDQYFSIPGVEEKGNALRWRIVAILFNEVGYEKTKEIITSKFVQVNEMLAALNTISRSTSGKYQFTNYLIEQFVQRYILKPMTAPRPVYLSQAEYLSDHIQTIDSYLRQGSVYLVSSPNTGKTELIKKLILQYDKCVIVVPQHSILDSKFSNNPCLSPFILRTQDVYHLNRIPNKIICIWDTFEALSRKIDFSDYYILLDEVHNFILHFGFRNVIIKVLEALKDIPHQLWMTGTPCGEEALLGQHVRLDFEKKANTQYNVFPIQLDTNSKNEYIGYMESFLDKEIADGKRAFVYDNYDHQAWKDYLKGKSAHYVSIYKDTDDVNEINQSCKSTKEVVVSTSYLGEGVDIKGYEEVDVILPTNLFVSETNVRQFMKRFRDASVVNVYLFQYTKYMDNHMPYKQKEIELHQGYIKDLIDSRNERNPKQDEVLMIDHLTQRQIRMIASDVRYQRLYNAFFKYQSSPFNIYMSHHLNIGVDSVAINPIQTIPVNMKKVKVTSRINPELQSYVNINYERLSHWIDETNSYDEVISFVEAEINQGDEVPYRKELRDLLEIISVADDLGCLKDCALYFKNEKGVINWAKVSLFCQHIKLKMGLLTKQITMYSNVYDCMMDGKKVTEQIDKSCSLLRFRVTGKPAFRNQVAKFKEDIRKEQSMAEKSKNLFEPQFVSIFNEKKVKKASKPKAKPVIIVNIATGATRTFSTQKECQEFLGISKPTFKSFAAGSSKLNKSWRLQ